MGELKKIGENTYFLDFPSKIGICVLNNNEVCLIDSGNDKEAAKKAEKVLEKNNWKLKFIINTHSHADHIGGNHYLQEKFDIPIYSYQEENCFVNYPILEPVTLYGANPLAILKNKFLLANMSSSNEWNEKICEDIKVIELFGHSKCMIGIETKDNILFLGDALASEYMIEKYKIFYIYDIKKYLETLDYLDTLKYNKYVISHGECVNDIKSLILKNKLSIENLKNIILNYLSEKHTYEEILKYIFDHYNLDMNIVQYYLIGTTIKSFLTYLMDENLISITFEENKLIYLNNQI